MAWLLIVLSIFLCWLASLCKIYHSSYSSSRTTFLTESNTDGMGNTRNEELYQACAVLKVPLHQIKVLDNPKLQDGFRKVWDHDLLAKIIEEEVASKTIDSILTFDSYGISGHCNHKDVHHGKALECVTEKNRSLGAC